MPTAEVPTERQRELDFMMTIMCVRIDVCFLTAFYCRFAELYLLSSKGFLALQYGDEYHSKSCAGKNLNSDVCNSTNVH